MLPLRQLNDLSIEMGANDQRLSDPDKNRPWIPPNTDIGGGVGFFDDVFSKAGACGVELLSYVGFFAIHSWTRTIVCGAQCLEHRFGQPFFEIASLTAFVTHSV
jgi:hypothetical protein